MLFGTQFLFPLVQLPKKFRGSYNQLALFALEVSISSTSEEVQSGDISVKVNGHNVSISSTSEEVQSVCYGERRTKRFPLVQLPKKFRGSCI